MTLLCDLARTYGTDKGGAHTIAGETCHNYTPTYYGMWEARRRNVYSVLEIGVNFGCSLRMWRDFFPNAMVYGLDNNPECLFKDDRIQCFAADQGNADSLLSVMNRHGIILPFDFIVDDGSHEEHDQIISANTLIPYLAKTGLYVIEDIMFDCQPERYMAQVNHPGISINTGVGIGKAHCIDYCSLCHGKEGERLLVFARE